MRLKDIFGINSPGEPTQKIMNFYTELYTSKGKQVVPIDEAFGSNPQAWNFKSPKGNKKRYYSIDVRFLHDKYNIDELLIVTLHYGLQTVGRSHAPYIVSRGVKQ